MNTQFIVSAVDYHTAGEPFRIISGGVPAILGDTVLDKRSRLAPPESVPRR